MFDALTIATRTYAEGSTHHGPNFIGLMAYTALTVAIIIGLLISAKKGINDKFFTKPITQAFEHLYFFLENLVIGIIGPHGRKYIPMIVTFWLMIFVSNCLSLFFPTAPTADLSFNLGMALIAIGYVQYEGIKANGFVGHFSHFAGPKMGGPLILINVMLFCIELVSEMMKNVSLTLRLYGNIDGGHRAADAMNALGKSYYIPFGAFLLPVKLMTCVVQALIFSLLVSVYIGLVTHHDHGDEDHGHEPAGAH
jgi:F-type H+-transporting ATPase subunit a